MDNAQIRVRTEGFRAIAKADIIINGITVVAGENGSGKSTLSKLLYFLYKTVANYDALVGKELWGKLQDVYRFLEIIRHELLPYTPDKLRPSELGIEVEAERLNELRRDLDKYLVDLLNNIILNEEQMEKWLLFVRNTESLYSLKSSDMKENNYKGALTNGFRNSLANRLRYIANDVLNEKRDDKDENSSLPFDKIEKFVEFRFKEALEKVKSRPTTLFVNALKDVFSEGELPKLFEVFEYEYEFVSLDKNNLSLPYSVQNAIYIETPMMLGIENSAILHWNDLNELLKRTDKSSFSGLSQTIKDVIGGDISVEVEPYSSRDFQFKRADGSIFNLLDCATGIKSFAILQLLLKNGSLTDKTLLIIDEPESNLHPQWIIEYARLIVLLNKEIGMKFFIASHNPDMVSALKYISEKERTDKNLNFYLAEQTKNKYSYNYKHLGTDIEPIFTSFNIALERINQYGA